MIWPAGRARAVTVLTAILVVAASTAAVAQPGPDIPQARLMVTELSGVLGPGGAGSRPSSGAGASDLSLKVRVDNRSDLDLQALQVVVEVHPSVGGARSVLQEALDTQHVTGPLTTLRRVDVAAGGTLRAGNSSSLSVTIPGDEIGWEATNDVYPIQVSVLLGAQVLDRVVTAVVYLTDRPASPLRTSVVWPIDAPTRRTPAGRYAQALPDELAPGRRLDRLLRAVERFPDAPVLLAPDVELVEELADRANGFTLLDGTAIPAESPAAQAAADLLQRLRMAVTRGPLDPVTGPYGGVDVAALAGGPPPLAAMADVAVDAARTRTQALLGRAPDLGLFLATTPVTSALLGDLGADDVLLTYDQVIGPDVAGRPDLPDATREIVGIPGQGAPRTATVADPYVAAIVADPPLDAGLVVARQRLVAETALLYLTEPGRADRALLVFPPLQWNPAPHVASAMLEALATDPWLSLGRPSRSSADAQAVLRAAPDPIGPQLTADLIDAQAKLDALRAAMPTGTPQLNGQTVTDLEDALLRAVTPTDRAGGDSIARQWVREVTVLADGAFGQVRLAGGTQVTLTSSTGEVPVTLERRSGQDIEVVVEVHSANALRWADDTRLQRVSLTEGQSKTVSFSTRALSRGTFPVTVSVWDPTRHTLLDVATLSVRSTAISRPALIAVAVVVAALLLAGIRRRRRAPQLEVVH